MSRDKSVHVTFFFHGKECLYRLYNCGYRTPGQRRLLTASLLKNAKEKASESIPWDGPTGKHGLDSGLDPGLDFGLDFGLDLDWTLDFIERS